MSIDGSLRRNASRLALAGAIEYGLQLAIPILLVRHLDADAFAQYRLLWLLASTALAIAPAYMPQSLFYFLPRTVHGAKGQVIGNVLFFLIISGCLTGLITLGWNPFLPALATQLFFQTHGVSSIFLAFWVVATMLDVLPTADGKSQWQSKSTITLAVIRTSLLAIAAIFTGNIVWVIAAMLATALAKTALLSFYVRNIHPDEKFSWRMTGIVKQLNYSMPFAFGNAFFLLRMQADQWVVASMLSATQYAMFSIAAVFLPVASLIRQPVNNAMMPRLNSAHDRGELTEIVRLIVKSNGATALLLVPIVGALFTLAPELVEIIYTSRYQQTAPVMQIYLIGMTVNAFAMGHVLSALDKGRSAVTISAFCLFISIALSVVCVHYWGMIGGALGSVCTLAVGEFWAINVVASALGVPPSQLLAWSSLRSTFLAASIAVGGAALLGEFMPDNIFLRLLVKGTAYLIFFVPSFLLFGGKTQLYLIFNKKP